MTFRSRATETGGTGVRASDVRQMPVTIGHYRIIRILGQCRDNGPTHLNTLNTMRLHATAKAGPPVKAQGLSSTRNGPSIRSAIIA